VAAIVCLGVAWGLAMHSLGWAQLAHFAQVRALADGQAEIDPWHWETNDKAWIEGHFYSVKSPGVPALTLPLYLALDNGLGDELAEGAVENARGAEWARWAPHEPPPLENYGYLPARAERVEARLERNAPMIWALTLLAAVIPAVLLLLGVRWAAERIEPGYGTAAAITLGVSTIVMVFAAEYFSHVISAALGFAAFAVLMRERDGPPRASLVALAGLLAGLAVSFEYQVGLVGAVLLLYALARREGRARRGLLYAAGALAGALPALAFNAWALGSPFEFAYGAAVDTPGFSGHDTLGLNDEGFFGITVPKPASAIDLLIANRGLLVLTPVIAAAAAGVLIMRRGSHRAEANTIAAIGIAYLVYNAGYWLPFGGGTPGPRFLIPALPFVALGLATAYRRLPALTLGLAIPSAIAMFAAAISFPLLGEQGPGTWLEYIGDGRLEHTLLSALGASSAWLAIAPVAIAWLAAIAFAARATPSTALGDLRPAIAAVVGWAALATLGPGIAGEEAAPLSQDPNALILIAIGAGVSLLVLCALGLRERAAQGGGRVEAAQPGGSGASERAPEPALGGPSS
jgi:hypothetical protein